jgi:hypothetical protein
MFSGSEDSEVEQGVMNKVQSFFAHYLNNSKLKYYQYFKAAHGFPTDLLRKKQACSTFNSPFILNCDFDSAGRIFKHIIPHETPLNL